LPWSGIQFESITAEDVTRAATITDEWYDPSFPNPDAPYFPGASADWNWLYLVELEKENFSEELRLTSAQEQRLRWTAGGNYLLIPVVNGGTYGIVPFGALNFPDSVDGAHSYAGFGGVYFDIVPGLELGVEGRYQRDSIFTAYSAVVDGRTQPAKISAAFDAFTPRVSLKYKLSPDTSVYALYSRGWLPGAINSQLIGNASVSGATTATAAQIQAAQAQTGAGLFAQPETLDTGEVGIKTNFLDGRGFLTFDLYGGKVTNEQVQNNFTVPGSGLGSIFYSGSALANQGAVDIDGIETEIAFQVTPELHVQAAYAYNNTKITAGGDSTIASIRGCSGLPTPYPAYCTNVIGNHLPNAPESQGYVDASYTRAINSKLRWFAGADYVYVGTKYADTANYAQTGVQQLVNIRFGVSSDTWKLEAWGKNITNNKTPDYLNDQAVNYNNFTGLTTTSPFNALEVGLPQKPTYGLRLTYRL
jgi:iron complex outermembrane receptor protein